MFDSNICLDVYKRQGYAFPFGIFEGNNPIGFLMVGYDKDDYWKDAPAIADGNYNLWRLMIDKKYQNRGYGKQAVELALKFIRTLDVYKRQAREQGE